MILSMGSDKLTGEEPILFLLCVCVCLCMYVLVTVRQKTYFWDRDVLPKVAYL